MFPECQLVHFVTKIVVTLILLSWNNVQAQTPDRFQQYPTAHTVPQGGTVTLPCVTVAEYANSSTVLWRRDGIILVSFTRYQMNGNQANGDYSLTISGAVYSDDHARWSCQIVHPTNPTADNAAVSPEGTLEVQIPPTGPPSCTQAPAGDLTENASVDLTCSSSGGQPPASLSWTSGSSDATIPAQPTQTPGDNPSLVVSLTVDRNYNNVQFTCTAQHPAVDTDRTCDVTLSVLYAPSKPTCSAPQNVILGQTTPTLTCLVTDAHPAPDRYIWKKNGTNLPLDPRYQNSSTGSLTINSLVKSDTGSYSCVASNSQGTGEECDAVQLTVQFAAENTNITCTPANQYKKSSSLECTCTASGVPVVNSFTWTKDGSPLPTGANATNGGAKLVFSSLAKVHTGTYRCSASNGVGVADTHDVNITVRYAPNATTVTATPSATREEGTSITLTCTADAEPGATYTWAKVGGSLPPGVNMDAGSLQISQLNRTDSGVYRCTADNGIDPDGQDTIDVDVQYPPEGLSITANTSEVAEGDDISLSCTVMAANPAVQGFSWSKSEGSLPVDAQGETTNQLQISNLTIQDSGIYICTASNNVSLDGTAQHPLFVQYLDAPTITINTGGSGQMSHTTPEGQSLSLECTAEAYPNATIVWSIPDGSTQNGSVLYLGQVSRTQAGTYNCTASNIIKGKLRSKNANLVISVNYPPSVDTFTADSNPADENTPVTMTCTVDSNPAPTDISIVRVGTGSEGDVTLATGQGRTLSHTIQDVAYTDTGTYRCQADNGIGNAATGNLELLVNYVPVFDGVRGKYAVAKGDPVTMTCSVTAYPTHVMFTWSKDGGSVPDTATVTHEGLGSTLSFTALTEDDYGFYNCNATNIEGSRTSTIELANDNGGGNTTIIITIAVVCGVAVAVIVIVVCVCVCRKSGKKNGKGCCDRYCACCPRRCCCLCCYHSRCCCVCCQEKNESKQITSDDRPASMIGLRNLGLDQSTEIRPYEEGVQMSSMNIYNDAQSEPDDRTRAVAGATAVPLDPNVQYSTVNKNVQIPTGNPYDDVHFERDENMVEADGEAAGPVNPAVQYATVNKNIQIATGNPYDDVNFERDEKTGSVAGATAVPLDPTAQYATVNKNKDNGTPNPNTVYAQVNKDKKKKDKEKPTLVVDPSSEYATIDKSKKKKKDMPPPPEDPSAQYSEVKKGKKKDRKASAVPEVIYTEVKKDKKDKKDKRKPAAAKKPNAKESKKNQQGLIYAELSDFQLKPPPKKPTKAVPPKPRYQDEPTEYAAINWNASRRRGQEQSQSGSDSDVETI